MISGDWPGDVDAISADKRPQHGRIRLRRHNRRRYITSRRAGDIPFMTVYASSAWSGSDRDFLINVRSPARPYGWIWPGTIFWTGTTQKKFRAAIRELVLAYTDLQGASVASAGQPSICDLMRQDMNTTPHGTAQSSYVDIPVVESPSPLIISSTTPPPVVDTPIKSLTPNNRSLCNLDRRIDHSYMCPYPGGSFQCFPRKS